MTTIPAPTDEQMVLGALRSLGTNADEVADTLRELGVKGSARWATACPIAKFIKGLDRRYDSVCSTLGRSVIFSDLWTDPPDPKYVDHPVAVTLFIEKFDHGSYPDLRLLS